MPDGVDTVDISRFHSRNLINPGIMIGARLPMFATASGLAILARMAPDDVETVLAGSSFIKLTDFTETDPGLIRDRLTDVRKKGHAVAYQEHPSVTSRSRRRFWAWTECPSPGSASRGPP